MRKIGILSFHGDIIEHAEVLKNSAENLRMQIEIFPVRTKEDLKNLDALIIPGGESPTLQKLLEREGMWQEIKKIKNIFGTCAGAIMLAKKIEPNPIRQKTLGLMGTVIDRNAYGRQTESFEKNIKTVLGPINAVFIRAPKIKSIAKDVKILAEDTGQVLACEQKTKKTFYLATCFHPELTGTKFHEYFLKNLI